MGRLQQFPENIISLQKAVEVAGARHLHFGDTRKFGEIPHDLGSNLTWRPLQLLGQLKAKGKARSPSSTLGGCSATTWGRVVPVAFPNVFEQSGLDAIDQRFQHGAHGLQRDPFKSLAS